MKASCLFLVLFALLFTTAALHAQIPRTLSYQGVLSDTAGNPRPDGSYQFTFRLYDVSTGGTAKWTEQKMLSVADGLFYTTLGDQVTMPDSLKFDRPYWLGIQVAAEPELTPRDPLTSVGYSFSSIRSDTAQYARSSSADTTWSTSGGNIYRLSGNVGIGITNPTATFEVGGGGALKVSGLSQFEGEVPGAGTNWNLGTFGDPKGTIYGFSRFGTVHLAIDVNSGNVGIGTTNPSHKLHSVNTSPSGAAVFGYATASSGTNYGVYGESSSLTGLGVFGKANSASGLNYGVFGQSNSTSGNGVYGLASATSGETFGMYGLNYSTMGRGVYGWAAAESGTNYGVYGTSSSTDGSGVYGIAIRSTGATNGVKGQSNSTTGRGVFGVAPTFGVAGYASATSGTNYGVFGETISPAGYGVYGNSNNVGVFGSGVTGVRGQATTGFFGVHGTSSSEGWGVYGVGGIGVRGETNSNVPSNNVGVYGLATPTSGFADGVWGVSNSTSGAGVFGNGNASSGTNYGVYGTTNSSSGYAGFFSGRVHVAGTLSKSGGQFKIDHPLDPANKYLNHSFVESPDMMNIYNGNITLDAGGEAWVILPEWFEALNKDFRYQLTGIGGFAPVYIAEEITGNRFKIAGGIAGMKISWQVTGIRKDAWAEKYRIPVEEEKKEDERGRYINPDAFGLSKEMGIPSIRLPILSERRGKGE